MIFFSTALIYFLGCLLLDKGSWFEVSKEKEERRNKNRALRPMPDSLLGCRMNFFHSSGIVRRVRVACMLC